MNEFIEKLIGRLEEKSAYHQKYGDSNGYTFAGYEGAIEIVNQLAEEYKHCIKSSCSNCEVYDKEKHYCPKWCEVIKHTTSELEEEYNNDFCEWKIGEYGDLWKPSCGDSYELRGVRRFKFCPYCGKKIKVIDSKGE